MTAEGASRDRADLLQGSLDLLILKALLREPLHGWGISKRIRQLSDEVLQVNQGSLYPALYRLEERGWIASEWGVSENNRRARFYSITKAGLRQLSRETENWDRIALVIGRVLRLQPLGLALEMELQLFVQIGLAAAAKDERSEPAEEDVPGAHGYVRSNTRLTPADSRSHFETSASSCLRPAFVSA